MTTIACNRREMAADGRVNLEPGTSIVRTRRKILRIGDAIVGTCGGVRDGNLFLDWYKAGGQGKPRRSKLVDLVNAAYAAANVQAWFDEHYDRCMGEYASDPRNEGRGGSHAATSAQ